MTRFNQNWRIAYIFGLAAIALLVNLQCVALAASGTWSESTGDGPWSNAANWSGGTIADGADSTANFSAINVDAVAVNGAYPGFFRNAVMLDSARTIGNLTFGDANPATPGGWQFYTDDPVNNILTLSGTSPTITVNPLGPIDTVPLGGVGDEAEVIDDAEISNVALAGTSGFTKMGSGILSLAGMNPNLTGTINVNEGTLRLRTGATFDFETLTNAAVTRFTIADGATLETQVSIGQNAALPAAAGVTVPAGATATLRNIATNNQFISNVTGGAGSTLNYIATTGALTGSIDRDWSGFANINFTGTADTQSQIRLRPNGATFNAASFATTAVKLDNMLMFTNTNSGGNTLTIGSLTGTSTATLQGGGGQGTEVTYTIGGLGTSTTFAGNVTGGNGINIVKVGAGTLELSGTLSYQTTANLTEARRGGVTRVEAGMLKLSGTAAIPGGINDAVLGDLYTTVDVRTGATLDVSAAGTPYSTAPIQQVIGTGTVAGNYIHDEGRIRPADVTVGNSNTPTPTAGTITFANDLSFAGSGEIVYDMGLNPAAGNDRIQVNGVTNLTGSSTKVTPNFLGGTVPTSGTYTILNSLGSFTGTPAGWTVAWPGRGAGPTVVANGAQLQFDAVPVVGGANLNWTGVNGSNWDVNATVNWRNNDTNMNDKYFNDDNVTFADTHTGATPVSNFSVNLLANVAPRSVTVDSANNYTFAGPGVITGTSTFTKRGASTVFMQKANTFSGAASVEAGTVDVGNLNGGLGTGVLTLKGATIFGAMNGLTNSALVIESGNNTIQSNNATFIGLPALSGSGNLTVTSADDNLRVDLANAVNNFTGSLTFAPDGVTGLAMTVRVAGAANDLPAAAVALTNGTTIANRNGGSAIVPIELGALSGDSSSAITGFTGGSSAPGTNWLIGGLNTSTAFAGSIVNGAQVSGGVTTVVPTHLTKVGSGTLALSGANTYTGDTTVSAGALSITTPYLANAADVYLATGAVLTLDFSDIDVIDSLFINGVSQATGTWGSQSSTATHKSDLFSGSGLLQVSNFVAPPLLVGDYNGNGVVDAADYTVWRNNVGNAGTTLQNRDPLNVGNVGQGDYASWKSNFGTTLPPGAGSLADAQGVPEPTALVLAVLALLPAAYGFRARTR